ncbi:MAG: STAS domain-containing protein [Treponema sp.]|nr:STAS domain-containing protein [Candidatus Treponema equifaecale]
MASKKSDTTTIKWQGTAGIEQAHSLQEELLKAFNKSNRVLLDISEVEDIDITGIQLIIAARKEADATEKAFFITGKIPEAISEFTAACSISLTDYALPETQEAE